MLHTNKYVHYIATGIRIFSGCIKYIKMGINLATTFSVRVYKQKATVRDCILWQERKKKKL